MSCEDLNGIPTLLGRYQAFPATSEFLTQIEARQPLGIFFDARETCCTLEDDKSTDYGIHIAKLPSGKIGFVYGR